MRIFFAILILVTMTAPAHADITGKARVIDGDTIEIGGTKWS
jgi:hypothetical protein